MRKSFEEIAVELIRIHEDSRAISAEKNRTPYYEVPLSQMLSDTRQIADSLAQNAKERIERFDEEGFDKAMIRMLEGANNEYK